MRQIQLFLAFFCALSAQSLAELLELGVKQNPKLKSLTHRVHSSKNFAASSSYLADPKLKASYFPSKIVTANGAQVAAFSLEQRFPSFGTLGLKEELNLKASSVIEEQRNVLTLELTQQITEQYIALAAIDAKQALLKEYEHVLQTFSQSSLTRYEHGTGSQVEILKIQTELSAIKNRRLRLNAMRLGALSRLNYLCATSYTQINARFPSDSLALRQTFQAEQNHTVKTLVQKREHSALKLRLSEKKSLPSYSLGVTYQVIDEHQFVEGNKDAFGLTLGFSLPLWSGKYSNEEEAMQNQIAAYDELILDRSKELSELVQFQRINIADQKRSLVLLKNDLIPKAQLSLKASISAYETGQINFLSLIDSQRLLLGLQEQEIETRKELHIAFSQYKKYTGRLTERIK